MLELTRVIETLVSLVALAPIVRHFDSMALQLPLYLSLYSLLLTILGVKIGELTVKHRTLLSKTAFCFNWSWCWLLIVKCFCSGVLRLDRIVIRVIL